jgi:hypothetical protein
MKIDTNQCKEAIVKFIQDNPGHVAKQFVPEEDEGPSQKISNWKRMNKRLVSPFESKEYPGSKYIREFDCVPYDDQLRARVYDDGSKILHVVIESE